MARVLIAEDENNIRNFVKEALEIDDHEVTAASNGKEALEALEQRTFDVLITDLKMPHVGGIELATKAKEILPDMQLIIMTAYGSVQTAVQAMKMGALDYLQKPLKLSELRALVRRAEERARIARTEEPAVTLEMADLSIQLSWGAPAMDPVLSAIERVSPTNASVLLCGESGVGKDVFATVIHELSKRHERPFLAINCASISESLSESELFGHERGAFTGANASHSGLIEEADGGTLFLDELGSLHPQLQAKLLRVLESKTYRRVGSSEIRKANVRWIAATNQNLRHMVEIGSFRKDLYHRLAVFPIMIPPLRARRDDIAPLAKALLSKIALDMGREGLKVSNAALTDLQRYDWPGNVRELRNTLERDIILCDGDVVDREHFQLSQRLADIDDELEYIEGQEGEGGGSSSGGGEQLLDLSLYELEKRALEHALSKHESRKAAAEHLGIPVRSLYNKIKRFELE